MSSSLFVSLSGVQDRYAEDAERFTSVTARCGVPVSLLVSPRRGSNYRLSEDLSTQEWFSTQAAQGNRIVLGGYDQAATKKRRGEFATISASEAAIRLAAATDMMNHVGLATNLFIPPRFAASPGCIEAVNSAGFTLWADDKHMCDLVTGKCEESKILSVGEGFLSAGWWCRVIADTAAAQSERGESVRLNVHAKHLGNPAVMGPIYDAMEIAVRNGLQPRCYGDRPVMRDHAPHTATELALAGA